MTNTFDITVNNNRVTTTSLYETLIAPFVAEGLTAYFTTNKFDSTTSDLVGHVVLGNERGDYDRLEVVTAYHRPMDVERGLAMDMMSRMS